MPRTLQPLCDHVATFGDRTAIVAMQRGEREEWSFSKLASHARRLSAGLREAGLKTGEPVALLAEDSPEWIVAALAILRAGAVIAPLDVQFADEALEHVLQDSEARFLFTTARQLPRLRALKRAPRHVVLLDAPASEARSWRGLLADADTTKHAELPQVSPNDPAALFYTSGTTGPPKGVPLTHANLEFQLDALLHLDLLELDDRMLLPLPLHHVYPFVIGMLFPLRTGLTLVLPQSLTGPELVRALKEGRVTVILGVPRLYRALLDGLMTQVAAGGRLARLGFRAALGASKLLRRLGLRVGRRLLGSVHERLGPRVRVVVSGGAALDPDLAWALEALGWRLGTGYGLTETAPMLTLGRPGAMRIGSVGRPLPGVQIRIAAVETDEDRKPARNGRRTKGTASAGDTPVALAHGQSGEIQARGPNVFIGYRGLPERTAEAFTEDGWFRTQDLGRFDARGWLHVEGRTSELIKTESGEKVQPEDLEKKLQGSPAVREVAILQYEHKLVALAVPAGAAQRDGADAGAAVGAAVQEHARHLPSYARITAVAVTREPLPRTRLGKLRRHLLPELYKSAQRGDGGARRGGAPMDVAAMAAEDQALLEHPAVRQTWDMLAEHHPQARLTPDSNLQLDLDVDSMEWLNVTFEIRRRAGVELRDDVLARLETVRDLLRAVSEAGPHAGPRASPLDEPEKALTPEQRRWLAKAGAPRRFAQRVAWAVNRVVLRLLFRVHAEGLENIPPTGAVLLTPNHSSYLDAPLVAAVLDTERLRRTWWATFTGLTAAGFLGHAVARLGRMLPIDQEHGAASGLVSGLVALKRGQTLVWFPEGQLTRDGELQEFKPGVGLLLQRVPVPVVPVWIEGSFAAFPKGRSLPRLRRIRVIFGKPIEAEALNVHGSDAEAAGRIARALRQRVAALGRRSATPAAAHGSSAASGA
ncbi:MAG TPA: AMP-binding protein [Planctomycetota bacterium]|nr:AMP-binding protein [Planctomycetota bacterium]